MCRLRPLEDGWVDANTYMAANLVSLQLSTYGSSPRFNREVLECGHVLEAGSLSMINPLQKMCSENVSCHNAEVINKDNGVHVTLTSNPPHLILVDWMLSTQRP